MTLMRAAALVAAPGLEFRFFGAGPLEAEMRAEAAAQGVNATFPGWVASPFDAFHSNDILVLPSSWEGLPYLLLEALDRVIPIIASDIAGNRAALGNGAYGVLFPLGDQIALAAVIQEALANLDALRARSENGAASLRARFGAASFWQALQRELGLCANA
jgi:glycosyltransferase involved in cell wall biosynthesis